jgi:hypothetical protein
VKIIPRIVDLNMQPIRISRQIIYWTLFVLLFTAVYASYDGRWLGTLLLNLIRLPFMLGIAYLAFHRNFHLPPLPMGIRISLTIVLILGSALLSRLLFGTLVYPVFFQEGYTFEYWNFSALFNQAFVMSAGVAGYGSVVYFVEKSRWSKRREELINEKKTAELNFYRAQVHPHFLFNTLNGIYAESLKKDGSAPELILKLSDLLRFMLYECNRPYIPLRHELKVLQDYVALEKLRYGERLNLNLRADSRLDGETQIPPLIFLAFVENAFKHGVSSQPGESFIDILVEGEGSDLLLTVKNTAYTDQKDKTGYQEGIGLNNIKRQLELIFEDRYSLIQENENGVFKTELRIPAK